MTTKFFPLFLCLALPFATHGAVPLTEAVFSQVIKDVNVVNVDTRESTKAKLGDTFKNPNVIRTGPDSLAELMAPDKTVTRVGANTAFSFEKSGRAINLEEGSVLFHSPKGKGGGTIRTKGASAAVLGTTLVVTATDGGGFKAIVLEGKGQITLPNGDFRVLTAGQVTFVLPGARTFGPQLNINLSKLVENSRLVQGFEKELPSKPIIQIEIDRQIKQINTGQFEDTKKLVVNSQTKDTVTTVDSTVLQEAVKVMEPRTRDVTLTTSSFGDYANQLLLSRSPLNVPGLGLENFYGLIGHDVTIATSSLDFTPYVSQTDFKIVADNVLKFQAPATRLTPGSPETQLLLDATVSELISPQLKSVTFVGEADVRMPKYYEIIAQRIGDLTILSGSSMSLDSVNILNYAKHIELNALNTLNLNNTYVSAFSMLINGGAVNLQDGGFYANGAAATLSAYGSDLSANGTFVSGDIVSLEANANANLQNLTANATTLLNVNAQQDLSVSGGNFTVNGSAAQTKLTAGRDASISGAAMNGFATLDVSAVRNLSVANGSYNALLEAQNTSATFTAGDTLSVNGPTLSGIANISLSARTVNLQNINFPNGSTVNLYSQFGQLAPNPNTGASSQPGMVNFILNVNYNNNPAQFYVGSTINVARKP